MSDDFIFFFFRTINTPLASKGLHAIVDFCLTGKNIFIHKWIKNAKVKQCFHTFEPVCNVLDTFSKV